MKKIDIDIIMEKFDWNNQKEIQEEGLKLAKNIKNLNAFIQPNGKNVWENCAKTLYERTDEELTPYLSLILEWLQDLNWPGAIIIAKRLKKYQNKELLSTYINESLKKAKLLNDEMWIIYLNTYEDYCNE